MQYGLSDLLATPVVWGDRDQNGVADHLANIAMDSESPNTYWDEHAESYFRNFYSMVCFTDGGSIPDTLDASGAWVVYAIPFNGTNDKQNWTRIGEGFVYLYSCTSSLEAELSAIHLLMLQPSQRGPVKFYA